MILKFNTHTQTNTHTYTRQYSMYTGRNRDACCYLCFFGSLFPSPYVQHVLLLVLLLVLLCDCVAAVVRAFVRVYFQLVHVNAVCCVSVHMRWCMCLRACVCDVRSCMSSYSWMRMPLPLHLLLRSAWSKKKKKRKSSSSIVFFSSLFCFTLEWQYSKWDPTIIISNEIKSGIDSESKITVLHMNSNYE